MKIVLKMSVLRYTSAVRFGGVNYIHRLRTVGSLNIFCKLSSSGVPVEQFRKIYEFPLIRIPRVIGRLKVYQTAFTVSTIPLTLVLQWLDVIPYGVHEPVVGLGVSGCVVLYSVGWACSRLVGAIYLSEDCSVVKISHLDFWGRRVDRVCSVGDVVPFSELPESPQDPYINLRTYSNQEKLRLTIKYGKIIDNEQFKKVFGDFDK